jgi:hypothetical protein
MGMRATNVGICVSVGLVAAFALSVITYFAYWPARLNVAPLQMAWYIGTTGAIFYGLVPVALLGGVASRHVPTTGVSAGILVLWLALLFVVRYPSDLPVRSAGWVVLRDFICSLPIALGTVLAFGLAARWRLRTLVPGT